MQTQQPSELYNQTLQQILDVVNQFYSLPADEIKHRTEELRPAQLYNTPESGTVETIDMDSETVDTWHYSI